MEAKEYFQSEKFQQLLNFLATNSEQVEKDGSTQTSIAACGSADVFRWFVPKEFGGWGWSKKDITEGYLKLSSACLSTTFVITQRTSSVQRLSACPNESLKETMLPKFASGERMTTVGISNLTTSGQHLAKPQLTVRIEGDQVILNGFSRWVTGAEICNDIMVGGHLEDGTQVLVLVPRETEGLTIHQPFELLALTSSQTGTLSFDNAAISKDRIVAGPVENVLQSLSHSSTGGLQTSTLAIGLATAASSFITDQSTKREDLVEIAEKLNRQVQSLTDQLLAAADSDVEQSIENGTCVQPSALRLEANSLVLRATESAMVVAKGAGFLNNHPASKWCREAHFFLVWSCPQEVQWNHLQQLVAG